MNEVTRRYRDAAVVSAAQWAAIQRKIDALPADDRRRLRVAAVDSLCVELPDLAKSIRSSTADTQLIRARMVELAECRA